MRKHKTDRFIKVLLLCSGLLFSAGCLRGCTSSRPPIHVNPNMDQQPKHIPQSSSEFFYDGAAMRTPVEGTIARGTVIDNPAFTTGIGQDGGFVDSPIQVDETVLARGQDRYEIYCTPCHGETGDGQSMLQDRTGVQSADLLQERLRSMPDGQIFDVITHGFGLMSSYAYPLSPMDRWSVVAYVRQLQAQGQLPQLQGTPEETETEQPAPLENQ